MSQHTFTNFAQTIAEPARHTAELDIVVPFTTPELTRAAVDAANRMGAGLNATMRLVNVQVVPFPLELNQSPVYVEFLKKQLQQFECALPAAAEIRLARDFEAGLEGTLDTGSVVILATRRRPWRTRTERLAACLRKVGHKVVMVSGETKHA